MVYGGVVMGLSYLDVASPVAPFAHAIHAALGLAFLVQYQL